jgi:hypothetical protein
MAILTLAFGLLFPAPTLAGGYVNCFGGGQLYTFAESTTAQ